MRSYCNTFHSCKPRNSKNDSPMHAPVHAGMSDYPAIVGKIEGSGSASLRKFSFTVDNDLFTYLDHYLKENQVGVRDIYTQVCEIMTVPGYSQAALLNLMTCWECSACVCVRVCVCR